MMGARLAGTRDRGGRPEDFGGLHRPSVEGARRMYADAVHELPAPDFGWNDEPSRDEVFEKIDAAIYTTDADGWLTYYNEAAAELWGYRPELGKTRWCGSWRIYRPDGTPLPLDQCPMAVAMQQGREVRGVQAVLERPDGTLVPFAPYPTPLRDASGRLVAGSNLLIRLPALTPPPSSDFADDERVAISPIDFGFALNPDSLTGCLQWAMSTLADVELAFRIDCERLDGWTGSRVERDRILAQLERRRQMQREPLDQLIDDLQGYARSSQPSGSHSAPEAGSVTDGSNERSECHSLH